ncbi:hypothetical protein LCGC14_0827150 [marine sediment metagenome]|uniref:Plasmid encoded RepA protein n=1 Tax=marine sediment metagenome TaxID=412755 RepID=A0A0F9SPD5_9ZZZZ
MPKSISNSSLNELITQALAIEAEDAQSAEALGFIARAMVQATLPHREAQGNEFTRTNGKFSLTLMAPSRIGLPYGSYPRLLLCWMTTEAVRTQERELVLGDSLSGFMSELGLIPTGGRWGSITRLKDQMARLLSSSISCTYDDGDTWAMESIKPADSARLWWSPKDPDQATLWKSTVTLGERFFEEITHNPVPVDLRALMALKRSPMALDLYTWITYRMFYLSKPLRLPWAALQTQFGSDYADSPQGRQGFKRKFTEALKKVRVIYPDVKVEAIGGGILLFPSKTHVKAVRG